MDVSELRKRILRALDDARRDASTRRTILEETAKAYEGFLANVAVPLVRQAAQVLNAAGNTFVVHTPADSVRLALDAAPQTFLELALDTTGDVPEVIGRVSLARTRQGVIVDERPIVRGRPVAELTDEDVSAFLVTEIPKLIVKR